MIKPSSHAVFRIFHTRWFYIVNVVLILLIGFSFVREMIHSRDIAAQIQALQKQSQSLQSQHLAIGDLKNAVQTESYVESEARLKLGLKKPGESLVIIKDASGSQTSPSTKPNQASGGVDEFGSPSKKVLANSSKWWYYFFNKQAYRDAQSL